MNMPRTYYVLDPHQGGGRTNKHKKRPKGGEAVAAVKWVSTGRTTTLKDGSKRTVYRNGATGERATKRMVAGRDGKTSARYVKLKAA